MTLRQAGFLLCVMTQRIWHLIKHTWRRLKGFRTYFFAFLGTLETLLEPFVLGGDVSWGRLWFIAGFALLRTVTTTAPGRKE